MHKFALIVAALLATAWASNPGEPLDWPMLPEGPAEKSTGAHATSGAESQELSFEERVDAQRAIERVYYSHQIDTKRPFEEVMPQEVLERKVRDYLKLSIVLEDTWNTLTTAPMLRSEVERMASETRMPERLTELFAALENDPILIRECLARPSLVSRLASSFFALDESIHADSRERAEQLRRELVGGVVDPHMSHPLRSVAELVRAERTIESANDSHSIVVGDDEFSHWRSQLPETTGAIGPLTEQRQQFVVPIILEQEPGRVRVASYAVPKLSWDTWWEATATTVDERTLSIPEPVDIQQDQAAFESPVARPCYPDDSWRTGALGALPQPRRYHSAVWTGNKMIIWGGEERGSFYPGTGGIYDPATDRWSAISTAGAPPASGFHTAVWSGDEMLIWGGFQQVAGVLNSGGRYDPTTDSWQAITTDDAPSPRAGHTAVWSGERMIVWGGARGRVRTDTGGLYDPVSDSWTPTSLIDVPAARYGHTAVWTDGRMVVWGGEAPFRTDTGGLYDPATDSWSPTSIDDGTPPERADHFAVWTGELMLVWGGNGNGSQTGGRYDPATNSWTLMTAENAPGRRYATNAVWTGEQMLVWGGSIGICLDDGGRYDPVADTWLPISNVNAPTARGRHTSIWTGEHMVVWGGYNCAGLDSSGGRYDPVSDSWTPTSTDNVPVGRASAAAVWTGNEMIAWGGYDGSYLAAGGRYDPTLDNWAAVSSVGEPAARSGHSAVWTGDEMIVWGGTFPTVNDGARYDPRTDTWRPMTNENARPKRSHTAIWTGEEMIVWGGNNQFGGLTQDGDRYDPIADTWVAVSTTDAPARRVTHTAVWTGEHMVIWGGSGYSGIGILGDGGRYDPTTDSWMSISSVDAPRSREFHAAAWTGEEMIIWGGASGIPTASGGRYDPVTDTWTPTTEVGAPSARARHRAFWAGDHMVIWGGRNFAGSQNTGGRYDPVTDSWEATSTDNAPIGRYSFSAVWTGDEILIWGGYGLFRRAPLHTGGAYNINDLDIEDCQNIRPTAAASADASAECFDGVVEVVLDGSDSSDPDSDDGTNDDIVLFEWFEDFGLPSERLLGTGEILEVALEVGFHNVALRVTDSFGETDTDEVVVNVADTTPPELSVDAVPGVLWPPNHRMVDVKARVVTSDLCGASTFVLMSVTSNEADNGDGDGKTTSDIQEVELGTADLEFRLRAERSGGGRGRIYTVVYAATDDWGNTVSHAALIVVPHDSGADNQ